MTTDYDPDISVPDLQRETKILEILRLVLWEVDENGKKYSIEKSCKQVGISPVTWQRWMQAGHVDSPLRSVSKEIGHIAYKNILPAYDDIIAGLVSLASGKVPDGSEIDKVTASDMLAAIRELNKIVPVSPMDQQIGGSKTEIEHLETFQPKQILVQNFHGDFIYKGDNQDVRMGQMKSVKKEEEDSLGNPPDIFDTGDYLLG